MKALVMSLCLVGAAFAAAKAAAPPAASPVTVTAIEPRAFGYFVGDLFSRVIEVAVKDPYRLEAASQPKPGRLTYWLDLRNVSVTERSVSGGRKYRLVLDYQSFYVPLSPIELKVPAMTLHFSAGEKGVDAKVPAFAFTMSPLREVQPVKPEDGPTGYLKPDAVPRLQSMHRARVGVGAALTVALLGLGLLAYHRAWWPFHSRPQRPFTRAAQAIERRLARGADPDAYRAGLIDLHRAFDASAGHRLLAEDVPEFLGEHSAFLPLQEDIKRFFASSRRAFYGNDLTGASEAMPFEAVADLGLRLGEAERREA